MNNIIFEFTEMLYIKSISPILKFNIKIPVKESSELYQEIIKQYSLPKREFKLPKIDVYDNIYIKYDGELKIAPPTDFSDNGYISIHLSDGYKDIIFPECHQKIKNINYIIESKYNYILKPNRWCYRMLLDAEFGKNLSHIYQLIIKFVYQLYNIDDYKDYGIIIFTKSNKKFFDTFIKKYEESYNHLYPDNHYICWDEETEIKFGEWE